MKTTNKNELLPGVNGRKLVLSEALDRFLETGLVLRGDLTLKIADIDLVYISLGLLIASTSKLEQVEKTQISESSKSRFKKDYDSEQRKADLKYIEEAQRVIEEASNNMPKLIDASSSEKAEKGIAKLVLTLVKLIQDLLEKESFRRVEQGNLNDLQVQKLGITFEALNKKIEELRTVFGLTEEDLNIDLGSAGRLR